MKRKYAVRFSSIHQNREFNFLFKKGISVVTWGFVCYYRENRRGYNRCGIVTSKKIGNAVKRNRAKRVIKDAFRHIEPEICNRTSKTYDFIFIARAKTPYVKSTKLFQLMKKQILDKLK